MPFMKDTRNNDVEIDLEAEVTKEWNANTGRDCDNDDDDDASISQASIAKKLWRPVDNKVTLYLIRFIYFLPSLAYIAVAVALLVGDNKQWFGSGLCLIYAIFIIPFLLFMALAGLYMLGAFLRESCCHCSCKTAEDEDSNVDNGNDNDDGGGGGDDFALCDFLPMTIFLLIFQSILLYKFFLSCLSGRLFAPIFDVDYMTWEEQLWTFSLFLFYFIGYVCLIIFFVCLDVIILMAAITGLSRLAKKIRGKFVSN